ncbi:MAG: Y-family DNA polymerase [Candidatus Babeliales bacterium]|nr:Y-family DNA polymerase [Candidatus Babeliales bacterium]
MQKRFALVDCNNFFVSCERLFNAELANKPVVVLSSNDACVIARSNEAKKLGIKMGDPVFKIKDLLKRNKVFIFSSNFTLYGDLSARVMSCLETLSTDIEVYSIDEAFMHLPFASGQISNSDQEQFYIDYANHIRHTVKKNVGLPVSIGIGPTKTLAKVANAIAKKLVTGPNIGVFDITNHPRIDEILATFPVEDVWGIGWAYKKKLAGKLIFNALELKNADQRWVRKNMTVMGLKTVQELNGTCCMELEDIEPRDNICVSRAFGKNLSTLDELKVPLSCHATRGCEKMRKQKSICNNVIMFFCYTSYQDPTIRLYKYASKQLLIPTNYTPTIISAAFECLDGIYKPGYIYKKIGIILGDLIPEESVQLSTLSNISTAELDKQNKVIKSVDRINNKFGNNKISFASNGTERSWNAKSEKRSPKYTTDWHEILKIKI